MRNPRKEARTVESVSRRISMGVERHTPESKLFVAIIAQAFSDCIDVARFRFGRKSTYITEEEALSAVRLCFAAGGVFAGSIGCDAEYVRKILLDKRYAEYLGFTGPIPLKAREALVVMGVMSSESEEARAD